MIHLEPHYLYLYSFEFQAFLPTDDDDSSRRLSSTEIVEQTSSTSFFPFIDSSTPHQCKKNAIVYLAQKKHSTYQRNSLELLERSLQLLHSNYLLLHGHHENVNVFIFHEGDFDTSDIVLLESSQVKGLVHLVNLTSTPFWQLPDHLRRDDPTTWKGAREYQLGYRHMMRWYALKLWDFFEELNQQHACQYDYIMRMDEESYIHSVISYDLFDHMVLQGYEYAFRQCSYEMGSVGQVWADYTKANPQVVPLRMFTAKRPCGFYNNFFIAKLSFFKSDPVQHFLTFVDQGGYMYRQRVNDLVLQTAAVYAFLPTEKIY